jgi:hypothetical protein
VAFAVPPHVVLLRHGLVLAEGSPRTHLPALAEALGETVGHLRVWADSPRLRTSMARDKVIDDEGRAAVDADLVGLVEQMRDELLVQIAALAATQSSWDERTHERYAYLHAHLALERHARPKAVIERALLRSPAGTAVSVAGLARRARAGAIAVVDPVDDTEPVVSLRLAAGLSGVPMVVGRWPDDEDWLVPLGAAHSLTVLPLSEVVVRIEPASGRADALGALVTSIFRESGAGTEPVGFARFEFATSRSGGRPWIGVEGAPGIAVVGGPLPEDWTRGRAVWLDVDHPICQRAISAFVDQPLFAAYLLATAIGARFGHERLEAERLTEAVARVSA